MISIITQIWRFALVMVFTVAAALNGGAHKISQPIDDATFVYLLEMGGTLDDLCGSSGSQSGFTRSCEVCNLATTGILPECASSQTPWVITENAHEWLILQKLVQVRTTRQNSIRAPPLV
jgi:hypothetical protein